MPKSPSQAAFDAMVKAHITPVTRAGGFRKAGVNFRRRHGETVQLINLQSSHGSDAQEKRFYVNVVVTFDALCRAFDRPIDEKISVGDTECSIYERLEDLDELCPERWTVRRNAPT